MSELSHTPPKAVQRVGRRAVKWIEDGKAGRNFTQVGRDRAPIWPRAGRSPMPR